MRGIWLGLGLALAALAAPLSAQRAPCRDCDSTAARAEALRGSLAEIMGLSHDVEMLEHQRYMLQQSPDADAGPRLRELERELRQKKRELARRESRLSRQMKGVMRSRTTLDSAMERMSRDLAERAGRQAFAFQTRSPLPPGYMGINFSGGAMRLDPEDGVVVHHEEYPVIVAVEPGSPAGEAGLRPGDRITAYNGRDVLRNDVSLSRLLRPGARVVVRVRRGGATKEIPLKIVPRPRMYVTPMPGGGPGDVVIDCRTGDCLRQPVRTPAPPRGAALGPLPPLPPIPATPPLPPAPLAPEPLWMPFAGGIAPIAGAELVQVNADLRDAFGVTRGVLVTNVTPGSPAAESGLRGGDVIVRANRTTITTPRDLQRALVASERDGDALSLEVVRKKARRRVVLRW